MNSPNQTGIFWLGLKDPELNVPKQTRPPWFETLLHSPTHPIREILVHVFSPDLTVGQKYTVIAIPPKPWGAVPRLSRPPETHCRNEIAARSREMLAGKEERWPGYYDGIPNDPQDAEQVARAWLIRRSEVSDD